MSVFIQFSSPAIPSPIYPEFQHFETTYSKLINGEGYIQPKTIGFHYYEVPYTEFLKNYESTGWIKRKFLALPDVLIGISRLVVHTVATLFYLLKFIGNLLFYHLEVKQESEDFISLRQNAFCAVRDLEEIAGSSIMIFNDAYGRFLRERSLCHKESYFMKGNHGKYTLECS